MAANGLTKSCVQCTPKSYIFVEVIVVEHDELQYQRISDSYALQPEEQQWLREQELSNALAEVVDEKFHDMFYTDDSRDSRDFWRMLVRYQGGSQDYRAGIDRAMVTLTGYRLLSLMKLASGMTEEQV